MEPEVVLGTGGGRPFSEDQASGPLGFHVVLCIPDTTNGTAIGLPIRPGVVERRSMGRQSDMAVADRSRLGFVWPSMSVVPGEVVFHGSFCPDTPQPGRSLMHPIPSRH